MDHLPAKPRLDSDVFWFHKGNELRDSSYAPNVLRICRKRYYNELSMMSNYKGHACKTEGARSPNLIDRMVKLILPTFYIAACALGSVIGIINRNLGIRRN